MEDALTTAAPITNAWQQILAATARSPAFAPIANALARLPRSAWPTFEDFNCVRPPHCPVRFVAADATTSHLHYEQAIVQDGAVATRGNAHDAFNALVWLTFPHTKRAISERHVRALAEGGVEERTKRSPERDALTLFDESGTIVLASDASLLDALRDFDWQTLFVARRAQLAHSLRVLVLGHASYEQLTAPYLGLTCRALPLLVTQELIQAPIERLVQQADELAAEVIRTASPLTSRGTLTPLPVLGLPGWYDGKQDSAFYDNHNYFRPRPSRQPSDVKTPRHTTPQSP